MYINYTSKNKEKKKKRVELVILMVQSKSLLWFQATLFREEEFVTCPYYSLKLYVEATEQKPG